MKLAPFVNTSLIYFWTKFGFGVSSPSWWDSISKLGYFAHCCESYQCTRICTLPWRKDLSMELNCLYWSRRMLRFPRTKVYDTVGKNLEKSFIAGICLILYSRPLLHCYTNWITRDFPAATIVYHCIRHNAGMYEVRADCIGFAADNTRGLWPRLSDSRWIKIFFPQKRTVNYGSFCMDHCCLGIVQSVRVISGRSGKIIPRVGMENSK